MNENEILLYLLSVVVLTKRVTLILFFDAAVYTSTILRSTTYLATGSRILDMLISVGRSWKNDDIHIYAKDTL